MQMRRKASPGREKCTRQGSRGFCLPPCSRGGCRCFQRKPCAQVRTSPPHRRRTPPVCGEAEEQTPYRSIMTCEGGLPTDVVGSEGSAEGSHGEDRRENANMPGSRSDVAGSSLEFSTDRFAKVKADMEASLRRVRELGAHLRAGSQSLEIVTGKIEHQISLCSQSSCATPVARIDSPAGSSQTDGSALSISAAPQSVAVAVQPTHEEQLEEQQKMASYVSDLAKRFSGSGSGWGSAPTSPRTDTSTWNTDSIQTISSSAKPADRAQKGFAVGPLLKTTPSGTSKLGDLQWGCEFRCGFQGSFGAVSEHERDCALRHSSTQPYKQERVWQDDMSQAAWLCRYGCGYQNNFKNVELHEKACTKKPAHEAATTPRDVSSSDTPQPWGGSRRLAIYGCDYHCGFSSTFEEVAEHEKACLLSPRTQVPMSQVVTSCGLSDATSGSFLGISADARSMCALSSPQKARVFSGSIDEWRQQNKSDSSDDQGASSETHQVLPSTTTSVSGQNPQKTFNSPVLGDIASASSGNLARSPAGSLREWKEQNGIESSCIASAEVQRPEIFPNEVNEGAETEAPHNNLTPPENIGESLPPPARYGCDWDCGFSGDYFDVAEHEKTCAMRPAARALAENGSVAEGDAKDRPAETENFCLTPEAGGVSGNSLPLVQDMLVKSDCAQLLEGETQFSTASTEPRKFDSMLAKGENGVNSSKAKMDNWPRRSLWGSSPVKLIGAASPFLACGILTPAVVLSGPLTLTPRLAVEESLSLPLVA